MNILQANQKFYAIKSNDFTTLDAPCFSYKELIVEYSHYILKDDQVDEKIDDMVILERYFNDLYNMFLSKLTALAGGANINESEHKRMQILLDELIKVKSLLEKEECGRSQKAID